MNKIKNLINNLDKTDLKIMKSGLKLCFFVLLISVLLLVFYLNYSHNFFLYELGLLILKISCYIAVEFIVCGIIVDTIKKDIIWFLGKIKKE